MMRANCTLPIACFACSGGGAGATTGAYDCKSASTGWVSSKDRSFFGFEVSNCAFLADISVPSISVLIEMPGEPQAGTYTEVTPGVRGTLLADQVSAQSAADGSPARGTFTLKLTSVSNATAINAPIAGKRYDGEGVLDATLLDSSGGTTVNLHASF